MAFTSAIVRNYLESSTITRTMSRIGNENREYVVKLGIGQKEILKSPPRSTFFLCYYETYHTIQNQRLKMTW